MAPDIGFADHGLALPDPKAGLANAETEQALLGALLTKPELSEVLPPDFDAEHYADPYHGEIHRMIVAVGKPREPAGVAVIQALGNRPEDRKYIAGLFTAVISLGKETVAGYARFITDLSRRRRMVEVANRLVNEAQSGDFQVPAAAVVAVAINELDEIASTGSVEHQPSTMRDALEGAEALIDQAKKTGGIIGRSTGMPSVDKALGGLVDGEFVVLAGRPAMGKSAIGWQWALQVAKDLQAREEKAGVLVLSLEMTAARLGLRAYAVEGRIPLKALQEGRIETRTSQLIAARKVLADLPLLIEDLPGQTVTMMQVRARAAQRRFGRLALIMVDHIHIVRPEERDARNGGTWAIKEISNALQRMAKEFKCPVLALAQLSREVEKRDDKRPQLSDLRYSGDIEQDADSIMFVYRPEYYLSTARPEQKPGESPEQYHGRLRGHDEAVDRVRGKAELILAKARHGQARIIDLRYEGDTTSFRDPENPNLTEGQDAFV